MYPCFCILPLEFEVNIDIHKHENSEVIYSNRNKFPKEMSGNSRLQKHGKHVNRFPNDQMYRLNISYKQFYITLNEIWLYESDPNAPSTCSEPGGKQWQHSIRGWRNWTPGNKLKWNFNQKTKLFIHENASENILCEMVAILWRGRWVNSLRPSDAYMRQ